MTADLSDYGWREHAACANLMFRRVSNACESKWSIVSRYQSFKAIMYWHPWTLAAGGERPRPCIASSFRPPRSRRTGARGERRISGHTFAPTAASF